MPHVKQKTAYGILLSIIALGILVTGYLLRPKEPGDTKQATSQITAIQAEVERLRQMAEQSRRSVTTSRFAATANEAASHLVYVPSLRHSGIVWAEDGSILLPATRLPPQSSMDIQAAGKTIPAEPSVWGAGIMFTLVRPATASGVSPPSIAPPGSLSPGSWIVDVGLDRNGQPQLSPGNFGGLATITCGDSVLSRLVTNLPLDNIWIGSGLFDLDGQLVGVVAQCGDQVVPLASSAIAGALAGANDPVRGPLLRAGLRAEEISPKWSPFVRASAGLVVTDLWQHWPADRAGIMPGDVIVSVGGQPVESLAVLSHALQNGGSLELRLQRFGRSITVTIPAREAEDLDLPSVSVANEGGGVELTQVQADSSAAQAGFLPGDRILYLNGIRATSAAVMRLFSNGHPAKPVLAQAQRRLRRFLVVVSP
jgi:serine protease Do